MRGWRRSQWRGEVVGAGGDGRVRDRSAAVHRSRKRIFFILIIFLKNQEINPSEIYFQVLPLSNCVSQVGMTHEVVVSCALARLTSI
jgi:hypothetical protein